MHKTESITKVTTARKKKINSAPKISKNSRSWFSRLDDLALGVSPGPLLYPPVLLLLVLMALLVGLAPGLFQLEPGDPGLLILLAWRKDSISALKLGGGGAESGVLGVLRADNLLAILISRSRILRFKIMGSGAGFCSAALVGMGGDGGARGAEGTTGTLACLL